MKIKVLENMSPRCLIWDKDKNKSLFRFVNGEYETEDEYIISYWDKYYKGGVQDAEVIETPKEVVASKPTESDEKKKLRETIKAEFGVDMHHKSALKTLEDKLTELREG